MNLYARFSEDERPIPELLSVISFDVPDAEMEMEDSTLVGLGSELRFDCRYRHDGLFIEEIWLKRTSGRAFVFVSFDLSEAPASKAICAAIRRYYIDNPKGRKSLQWFAEAAEEEAAIQ